MHRITDAAHLAGTRRTEAGYLIADAFVARTGVQVYDRSEFGLEGHGELRVYRPEDEVRDATSMRTFSHAPITIDHPSEDVSAENWAKLAKGEVSTDAAWDGNRIRLPLIVKDAAAIQAIESGKRELSPGYKCDLEFTDGVTPDGEPYDAIQRNIRINHIALVEKGRAGNTRIGDGAGKWGAAPKPSSSKTKGHQVSDTLITVVLGDKAVNVAAKDAPAIEAFKAEHTKVVADLKETHSVAIGDKDKQLAAKDAEIDKLKTQVVSDEEMTKRVEARAQLVADAAKVAKDVKASGVSDADLRRAVVVAKCGDAAVKDQSDDYVLARFHMLVEDAGTSSQSPNTVIKRRAADADGDHWAKFNKKKEA